jgi:proteasome lid subunit RPN8/RPN11
VIAGGALRLPTAVRRAIVQHALRAMPLECCGFLLGTRGRVIFAVPMDNVAASPVRYRIEDRAHIDLRRVLRGFEPSLSIQGVYHSHPDGAARPSETDIREALYPEWAHVIVGLGHRRPSVRAFRIRSGRARAIRLR